MSKIKKLQNKASIRFFDQVTSAFNNYLIIIPSLLMRDFQTVAKISLILSIYTFWLGLVRVSIINEVLDSRNTATSYLVHLKKMMRISVPIPIFFPIYQLLGLSKEISIYVVLITIFGLQEELTRQFFLGIEKFLYAFFVDLTWLLISATILFRSEDRIENSLKAWFYGCIGSLIIAAILISTKNKKLKDKHLSKKIDHLAVGIPILLSLFTVSQNILLDFNRDGIFLGQLRSIQLFFLPAIFLINVQQSIYVPLISSNNFDKIKKVRIKIDIFSFILIVTGIITSVLYLDIDKITPQLATVLFLVAFSVGLNSKITFISISLIVTENVKYLTKSRFIWFTISLLVMCIFVKSPLLALVNLTIVDLFLLLYLQKNKLNQWLK